MEVWKIIPTLPNYEASTEGRIRRKYHPVYHPGGRGTKKYYVRLTHNRKRIWVGRFFAADEAENAYYSACWEHNVDFSLAQRVHRGYAYVGVGYHDRYRVHSLIALTFVGPRPDGLEINHIDGNKLNNRPDNLEYCTALQNMQHAMKLGLRKGK